jgi:hypothetical protein
MSQLSRETDALLKHGRGGESLSPHDRSRLKRAVLAQAAAASVVATTSTAAAWTTVAAKVAVGVAIVGSVVGVAAVVPTWRARAPEATAVAKQPARVATSPNRPVSAAPTAPSLETEPLAAPRVVPSPVAPARAPKPARLGSRDIEQSPSPLEEETRGWNQADDALKRGDPDTALRLLREQSARFPSGALTLERAAERVFALCAAGRRDEARQAASDFLQRENVGPLAARVRAACGNAP